MEFMDLPVEILILIFQRCDFITLESLYNTCSRMRNIVVTYGVVKHVKLSCNRMATVNTFKLGFFKDISCHITELNMRAMLDVTKTAFLPALPKLKNLKILDISYTKLNIFDLLEIQKKCPSINDITINLSFGKDKRLSRCHSLSEWQAFKAGALQECQSVFEHYENVHFVGFTVSSIYFKVAHYILAKAKLKKMKYTVIHKHDENNDLYEFLNIPFSTLKVEIPEFYQFEMYLLNWRHADNMNIETVDILHTLRLDNHEYIIIVIVDFEPTIYASPILQRFIEKKIGLNSTSDSIPKNSITLGVNTAAMIWNKETTSFDDKFFEDLFKHLKHYLPCDFIKHGLSDWPALKMYDWFFSMPITQVSERLKNHYGNRERQGIPNYDLNYDPVFSQNEKVELSLLFKFPANNAIALSENYNYLRKLTYLSLSGFGRYTADFFQVLFRCCHNLVTLNVHNLPLLPCNLSISRSLPLSRSLKNIRLIDKCVDFTALLWSFSQCPTLENIYIVDERRRGYNQLANPDIVLENCKNLYSVHIEAEMTEATLMMMIQKFKNSKKPYIHYTIQKHDLPQSNNYNPFLEVFRVNPIKPS